MSSTSMEGRANTGVTEASTSIKTLLDCVIFEHAECGTQYRVRVSEYMSDRLPRVSISRFWLHPVEKKWHPSTNSHCEFPAEAWRGLLSAVWSVSSCIEKGAPALKNDNTSNGTNAGHSYLRDKQLKSATDGQLVTINTGELLPPGGAFERQSNTGPSGKKRRGGPGRPLGAKGKRKTKADDESNKEDCRGGFQAASNVSTEDLCQHPLVIATDSSYAEGSELAEYRDVGKGDSPM